MTLLTEPITMQADTPEWARRAATFSERWDALATGGSAQPATATATATATAAPGLLERWRHTCARDDPDRFSRRLDALGTDESILDRLAGVEVDHLPWMSVARRAAARAEVVAADLDLHRDADWSDDDHRPFAAVWRTWADVCAAALVERGHGDGALTRSLVRLVDRRVATTGLGGLYDLFMAEVAADGGHLAYRRWVRDLLDGGFAGIVDHAPVWGRALAVIVGQWIDVADAFLTHLAADRALLARELGWGSGTEVVAVSGAGDHHANGREVLVVTAADGSRVVYKPRPLEAEVLVARVAAHVRDRGGVDVDLVPRVVPCGDHGWVAFVDAADPEDEAALGRYARRAGAALVICRLLGVTDLHDENVVVAGDRPVIVDLECLAHPPFTGSLERTEMFADLLSHDPLVRGGLLPTICSTDSEGNEQHGLVVGGPVTRTQLTLDDAGTGGMRIRRTKVREASAPCASPVPLGPLLEGMDAAYEVFRAWGPGALLDTDVRTRLVPRGTGTYARILSDALRGRGLVDGLAFSVELDAVAAESTEDDSGLWRLALSDAERRQLEQLDIPLLETDLRSTSGTIGGTVIPGVLVETGSDLIARAFDRIDPSDALFQTDIARIAWDQRYGITAPGPVTHDPGADPLAVATGLGDLLAERAVTWWDGTTRWATVGLVEGGVEPVLTGPGLYDGTAGIALFLAALASVTDDHRIAELAASALGDRSAPSPPPGSAGHDPGLAGGTSGVAFARLVTGRLLGDDDLVDAGLGDLLRLAAANPVFPAGVVDLIGGRAGLVLALTAAAESTGSEAAAEAAEQQARILRCEWASLLARGGHHTLVASRLGAAHGITGLLLAAARSHGLRSDPGLGQWTAELLARENDRIGRRGGVPARISHTDHRPDLGWCWGVSGHLVTRRSVARSIDLPGVDVGVDQGTALAAAARPGVARLCCGAAGLVEALPRGSDAHDQAVRGLIGTSGRLIDETGTSHPGCSLFRGVAGVGLTLLRVLDPSLPDVLTVDAGRREAHLHPYPHPADQFTVGTSHQREEER